MSLAKRHAVVTGSTSGIGLAIARALAKEGADVMINGFGDAKAIETRARRHRKGIRRQGLLQRRRHVEGRRGRGDDRRRRGKDGNCRHRRQQRRHPVRLADRGVPAGEVGRDPRHQPFVRVPHHPRGRPRHEGAEMGPHRQHRLGPFAGRLAVQGGLCLGQARPRRPHQDGRARTGDVRRHLPTASRPAMSGRRWWKTRSPTR